jgi:hypothetical protein
VFEVAYAFQELPPVGSNTRAQTAAALPIHAQQGAQLILQLRSTLAHFRDGYTGERGKVEAERSRLRVFAYAGRNIIVPMAVLSLSRRCRRSLQNTKGIWSWVSIAAVAIAGRFRERPDPEYKY